MTAICPECAHGFHKECIGDNACGCMCHIRERLLEEDTSDTPFLNEDEEAYEERFG